MLLFRYSGTKRRNRNEEERRGQTESTGSKLHQGDVQLCSGPRH